MSNISTFVFLDLETTGFPKQENNKTRITELCLCGVGSEHIRSAQEPPRIQIKLCLTFNPHKLIDEVVAKKTGLTNELLESMPEFQSSTVVLINQFLGSFPKPICLVAHYGYLFDFPILKSEILRTGWTLPADILCVDSLQAFQQLLQDDSFNNPHPSVLSSSSIPADGYDDLLLMAVQSEEKKLDQAKEVADKVQRKRNLESTVGDSVNKKSKTAPRSFKLRDLYERLTSKMPPDEHSADGDVNLLIECVSKMNNRFVVWANEHARPLLEIPPMEVGIPLGRYEDQYPTRY